MITLSNQRIDNITKENKRRTVQVLYIIVSFIPTLKLIVLLFKIIVDTLFKLCLSLVIATRKGIQMKNDKLDLIVSTFENETFSSFNLCAEDASFRKLLVNNAGRPLNDITRILVNYANENLI